MNYGEKLKYLRNKKGLSQQELTDRLHINRSTYARYETSSTQPDFDTLSKLADFFDVTIDYLLGRTDDKTFDKSDEEFENFRNNPSLERWYKQLPESEEEDLEALRDMWEIIQRNKNK